MNHFEEIQPEPIPQVIINTPSQTTHNIDDDVHHQIHNNNIIQSLLPNQNVDSINNLGTGTMEDLIKSSAKIDLQEVRRSSLKNSQQSPVLGPINDNLGTGTMEDLIKSSAKIDLQEVRRSSLKNSQQSPVLGPINDNLGTGTMEDLIKSSAKIDFKKPEIEMPSKVSPRERKNSLQKNSDQLHINIIPSPRSEGNEEIPDFLKSSSNIDLALTNEEVNYFQRMGTLPTQDDSNASTQHLDIPRPNNDISDDDSDYMKHNHLQWQLLYIFCEIWLSFLNWSVCISFFSSLYSSFLDDILPFYAIVLIILALMFFPLILEIHIIREFCIENITLLQLGNSVVLIMVVFNIFVAKIVVLGLGFSLAMLCFSTICCLDRTHPRKHRSPYAYTIGLLLLMSLRWCFFSQNPFFAFGGFTSIFAILGIMASIVFLFERTQYKKARRRVMNNLIQSFRGSSTAHLDFGSTIALFPSSPFDATQHQNTIILDRNRYNLSRNDLLEMVKITRENPDATFSNEDIEEILAASKQPRGSFHEYSHNWSWIPTGISFASLLFLTLWFYTEASTFSRFTGSWVDLYGPLTILVMFIGYSFVPILCNAPLLLYILSFLFCYLGVIFINHGAHIHSVVVSIGFLIFSLSICPFWFIINREMAELIDRNQNDGLIGLAMSCSSLFFFFFASWNFSSLSGETNLSASMGPLLNSSWIELWLVVILFTLGILILKVGEKIFCYYRNKPSTIFWTDRLLLVKLWNKSSYYILIGIFLIAAIGVLVRLLSFTSASPPLSKFTIASWSVNHGIQNNDGSENYDCIHDQLFKKTPDVLCLQDSGPHFFNGNFDLLSPLSYSFGLSEVYGPSSATSFGLSFLSSLTLDNTEIYQFPQIPNHIFQNYFILSSSFSFNSSSITLITLSMEDFDNSNSMQYLHNFLDTINGPLIVTGNFNLFPNGRNSYSIDSINNLFGDLLNLGLQSAINPGLNCTIIDNTCLKHDTQTDYIFYRQLNLLESSIESVSNCAYHNPLYASFTTI